MWLRDALSFKQFCLLIGYRSRNLGPKVRVWLGLAVLADSLSSGHRPACSELFRLVGFDEPCCHDH